MSDILLGALSTTLAATLTIIGILLRKLKNSDNNALLDNHIVHIEELLKDINTKLDTVDTSMQLGIQTLNNVWYKVSKL